MPELLDLLLIDNEQEQAVREPDITIEALPDLNEITIDALPEPDKATAELIAWLRMCIKRFLARPRVGYLPAELLTFGEDTPIHELQALRQHILTKLQMSSHGVTHAPDGPGRHVRISIVRPPGLRLTGLTDLQHFGESPLSETFLREVSEKHIKPVKLVKEDLEQMSDAELEVLASEWCEVLDFAEARRVASYIKFTKRRDQAHLEIHKAKRAVQAQEGS